MRSRTPLRVRDTALGVGPFEARVQLADVTRTSGAQARAKTNAELRKVVEMPMPSVEVRRSFFDESRGLLDPITVDADNARTYEDKFVLVFEDGGVIEVPPARGQGSAFTLRTPLARLATLGLLS